MSLFQYLAKNIKGEEKKGVLEAKDKIELAKILHEQGFFLVKASSEIEKKDKRNFLVFLEKFRRIPLKEKLFFFRNLQVMVSAGISLPRAIRVLAHQTSNQRFKKVLLEIEENLLKGYSLSQSFAGFPDVFSTLTTNMIKVGEESGRLEFVLKNLSEHLEKEYQLRNRVLGALLYPAVIISAMVGVGILMLVVVVPKLAAVFKDLGVELPFTTRLIIKIGYLFLDYWYLFVLFFLFLLFCFHWFIKTKKGRGILDKMLLKIPVISGLLKKVYIVEIIRTLAILIRSGVPILQSLSITEEVARNKYYKNSLREAKEKVQKGKSLAEALEKYSYLYSNTVIEMLKVGGETGKTDEILEKLANFYDEEVSRVTQNLSSIIEPVLILLIGAVVGFFAVSMIQPMYSLLGQIQ